MPGEEENKSTPATSYSPNADLILGSLEKVPAKCNQAYVVSFLQHNRDSCDLSYEHIEIIKNEIAGSTFLKLTAEKFIRAPFALSYGVTDQIEDLIRLLDPPRTGAIKILVSTNHKPFLSWTFQDLVAHFGIRANTHLELPTFQLPKALLNHDEAQELIGYTTTEIEKALAMCPNLAETTRLLAAYEILKQVIFLHGGKLHLLRRGELSGKLGNGPYDYVIDDGEHSGHCCYGQGRGP
ncbi:hypothetical protein BGX38DRAFT_1145380 [Terfezia claveryi]|nr:hypothetical protein BGX38DRAFT_1145380 [Terfezia claveryi]